MNPILTYLKNVFASKRIVGGELHLNGHTKADALLQNLFLQNRIPGLAITVLKEGETIFQKGYGFADVRENIPINPQQTIFRIASVSKPIAATALAYMVKEGILDLDVSFYTYVPDYPKKRWDFTIRQLAGHTAGVRAYKGKEYGLNEPYTIRDSLRIFKEDPLLFEPGKGYLYTSFGWVLISLAMEEASGIPFEEYVQEKVLNPLGLTNTFIPKYHPERSRSKGGKDVNEISTFHEQANLATFYTKVAAGFRKAILVNNFYKLAAGGYLSTSEDVAKLGQAYLDKKVIAEDVLKQFITSQELKGKPTYYGLGWQVSKDAHGRKFHGHVGNGVGGYSNFFVYTDEQLVVSILINCTDPKIQHELDEVVV
ncbi:serine hydrolase domain-containing protein [Maribacter sp. ACAM166]|uniref:serine hydrolase domain-containing protein n=1 Tax=Maribacter sp. ACAM166 TaxID=2508996 RepID=UPI0010FEA59D|nr:serine hydrolase domain-containing protein [Maribacter sp. ACAM166]TLP78827.1 beta-lactamase family protein [Maribacter sp. ACAM166]